MRNSRLGISSIAVCVIITVVIIVAAALFYIYVFRFTESQTSTNVGVAEIVGYKSGPGYVVIYVKPSEPMTVHEILIETLSGSPVCVESFPTGLKLSPGKVTGIPIIGALLHCNKEPPRNALIVIPGSNTMLFAAKTVDLSSITTRYEGLRLAVFVDQSSKSSGSMDINLESDVWQIFLAYPLARITYVGGSGTYESYPITVLPLGQNSLDVEKMSIYDRETLGPFVIAINPTFATDTWTFKVITLSGSTYTYTLPKLVNDRNKVVVDMLLLCEDTWYPGVLGAPVLPSSVLDSWNDIVIRITVFTNDTARIHVISDDGQYIHALFVEPPNPSSSTSFEPYAEDVASAAQAIQLGENYVSKYNLQYIKPYDYVNTVYLLPVWDTSHQTVDITNYVWLCYLDTGKCILRKLS
ncbi:MAG: hypothetical protein GXO23_06065 [Crenarchaeota archaeon]|nr:hypothetical protein [Thermoproteota archaeon]